MPAQAIIAALSVQSAGGGTIISIPSLAASVASRARRNRLAATPPATTRRRASPWRARNSATAFRVRSLRTSATASWKAAARSAAAAPSGASPNSWTARRTAVLRPENEKSQPVRPSIGRGSAKRALSPACAARSTAGPPG